MLRVLYRGRSGTCVCCTDDDAVTHSAPCQHKNSLRMLAVAGILLASVYDLPSHA